MPLNLDRLEKVKHRTGKLVAQCPACAEQGRDTQGQHLVVYDGGAFGCVAYPQDKDHRRRIAELVGTDTGQKPSSRNISGKPMNWKLRLARTNSRTPRTHFFYTAKGNTMSRHDKGCDVDGVFPSRTGKKASQASQTDPVQWLVHGGIAGATITCRPDLPLPPDMVPVLAWGRHTQASPWQDHPQLVQERQRRLLGWNRLGKPVWTTRQAPPPNGPEIHGPPPNHAWHQVAQQILHRDFEAEPADSSQLEAWRIGLRSLATQAAKAALARLEAVRLVRWGKKDLDAGRLLPRAAKEQA